MKKILHIASFAGNIGDQANQNGFRNMFMRHVDENVEFTSLEIRKFYRNVNEAKFDEDFIKLANTFDLVVFGGGGFFEICWDYSCTGTTIDMSIEDISSIKAPIVFNGIGLRTTYATTTEQIEKFRSFLRYCINSDRILVSLRNDGSYKNLIEFVGMEYSTNVLRVPDGGFFVETPQYNHYRFITSGRYITVNLAGDDLEHRFATIEHYHSFTRYLARLLDDIMKETTDISIVFVPHIFDDYKFIYSVIDAMAEENKRTRVCCVACYPGEEKIGLETIGLYEKAELSIGMRYHANVCPIGMNTPSIGISTEDRVCDLFKEVGLEKYCVDIRTSEYEDELRNKCYNVIRNKGDYRTKQAKSLRKINDEYCRYMQLLKCFILREQLDN